MNVPWKCLSPISVCLFVKTTCKTLSVGNWFFVDNSIENWNFLSSDYCKVAICLSWKFDKMKIKKNTFSSLVVTYLLIEIEYKVKVFLYTVLCWDKSGDFITLDIRNPVKPDIRNQFLDIRPDPDPVKIFNPAQP